MAGDPMRQTPVGFKVNKLDLEGVIGEPEEIEAPFPAVLICHPEPHLGGTMESPVVTALVQGLANQGLLTLRFNSRGVGASEGETSLGPGEMEDARAALKLLHSWPTVDRDRLAVAGYSFGAGISVRMLVREEKVLRAGVAISPPLELPPLGLEGIPRLDKLRRPLQVIIGGDDGLTRPDKLKEWTDGLGNPGISTVIVEGTDRSWQGKRSALSRHVSEFLTKAFASP